MAFEIHRIGGEDERGLGRLKSQAMLRTPLFRDGDNGRTAPECTRRHFFRTSAGIVGVTFLPLWNFGCDPVSLALLGAFITIFDVVKDVFNLSDPEDPIKGQMGFDNQTGGPLNIQAVLDLLDIDRGLTPDQRSLLLELAIGEAPTYEWSGLEAKDDGLHKSRISTLGESADTDGFTIKKVS